jgi:phosphodiesterase/alkaline phosphatase D-like protein
MKSLLLILTITATGSLLFSAPATVAQEPARSKQAARAHITQGPSLESAQANWAIITWTSNNPGGTDEHFGLVHYGTDPKNLSQTAKSHIRLNRNHSYTVFRVRIDGLQPKTTYYYKVDSANAIGASDGVTSPVKTFMTQ